MTRRGPSSRLKFTGSLRMLYGGLQESRRCTKIEPERRPLPRENGAADCHAAPQFCFYNSASIGDIHHHGSYFFKMILRMFIGRYAFPKATVRLALIRRQIIEDLVRQPIAETCA